MALLFEMDALSGRTTGQIGLAGCVLMAAKAFRLPDQVHQPTLIDLI